MKEDATKKSTLLLIMCTFLVLVPLSIVKIKEHTTPILGIALHGK